jgi:benzoyl-CoA reductase subunit A
MVEAKKVEFWRWPETSWVNPDVDWRGGNFVTAGVDIGSVSSQAVVMVDGQLFAYSNTRTGSDSPDSARKAMGMALEKSDMTEDRIDYCIGTGYGRVNVPMAQQTITEIACHARGANFMYGPEIRTVMDLIGVPVWEIGERSFRVEKEPPMISSTCVVFAKTEVVGLLQAGTPEDDIIAAYCSAMAHRITELLNRLGIEEKFAITGGIAKNIGVTRRLEKELGVKAAELGWYDPKMRDKGLPFDTQIAGGIGAALFSQAMLERGRVKSARKA